MDATTNSLNWFEIPVTDMQRAKHFYQVILSMHMDESTMMGMQMAFFPYEPAAAKHQVHWCRVMVVCPGNWAV